MIDDYHERLLVSGYCNSIYSIDMNTLKVLEVIKPKMDDNVQKIFPCIKMLDFHSILVGTGN